MRPFNDAPEQDVPTDGDRPPLQRVVGNVESERNDEPSRAAGVDDAPHGVRHMNGQAETEGGDRGSDAAATQVATQDEVATHDEVGTEALDEPARPDSAAVPAEADESAVVGRAVVPDGPERSNGMKPGDVPAAAATSFWAEDSARDFRDRWREAQLRFVDDPRRAAEDSRALIGAAVEALTETLASHRRQLDSWPADADTEQYRVVMQRYRAFFERVFSL